MKKKKIRQRMEKAIKSRLLCSIHMEYNKDDYRLFPLKMSEQLFLGAQEDEFQLNGYSIRRVQDIEKIKIQDNFSAHISSKEAGVDGMCVPKVDITDWMEAFLSLEKLGKIVIVEKENLHEKGRMFAIGKIEKVCRKHVCLRYFGPDGIWDDGQWKISYDEITSVTLGSRYAEVFSKYLPDPAEGKNEETEAGENAGFEDAGNEEAEAGENAGSEDAGNEEAEDSRNAEASEDA